MSTPSILVVDDEPYNFDVIEALLSSQSYELNYVADSSQALASLETFQPDLILMDVMMPEVNGIELCEQIKALPQWQFVPIIMVTALGSKTDLSRCLQAGADDYISKPINGLELRARVHSMLRIKKQYDTIQRLYTLQEDTLTVLEQTLEELTLNLAANISHELNTPINGIVLAIDVLKEGLDSMDTEEVNEILDMLGSAATRLEQLTRRCLFYLHLELQSSVSGYPPTVLSQSLVMPILKHHAQKFQRWPDLDLNIEDAVVTLPSHYLTTLLQELVDNALKFSEPQTPVRIQGRVQHGSWLLSISDTGRGMSADQVAKIGAFMQFNRRQYEQQGVGIGLKTVKKITELAGGSFALNSLEQQGTTVQIRLPLASPLSGADDTESGLPIQVQPSIAEVSLNCR